ncbi:MAG: sialate O-acetylesterase [Planctomycetes bacterium]|nr:sialate O-acetylesterase [Planctomycetota bacterium]
MSIRVLALVISFAAPAVAQAVPASVFSDHMVLQRDQPIAVWGTAGPNEEVRVLLDGTSASVTAGVDGDWLAQLPAHAAGGPFELQIQASNEVTIRDVLIGEVWVCSGQSNMSWSMRQHEDTEEVLPDSNDPGLRLLQFPRVASRTPRTTIEASWRVAGPETLKDFSAVAYGFGRHLRQTLDVPVGLVHTSWGGTRAEAWTREASLQKHEVLRPILERWQQTYARYPQAKERYDRALAEWKQQAAAAREAGKKPPRRPGAPAGPDHQHAPGRLHHGMIQPLVPMSFRGVIWYQGESNASRAYQYRTLFPTLIRDWRDTFGHGQFAFLFVQLASFEDKRGHPEAWAELREAQAMALAEPNTGMACILDLGTRNNIHPPHKLEVGRRLALLARADTYGQDVVPSGPVLSHYTIEGERIRLHFDHVGGGLVQKGEQLAGFEIATADGDYQPAGAVIDGDTVLVRGTMAAPRHVRYAWRHWPEVSLFNREGLPAHPFRTDARRGVTFDAR